MIKEGKAVCTAFTCGTTYKMEITEGGINVSVRNVKTKAVKDYSIEYDFEDDEYTLYVYGGGYRCLATEATMGFIFKDLAEALIKEYGFGFYANHGLELAAKVMGDIASEAVAVVDAVWSNGSYDARNSSKPYYYKALRHISAKYERKYEKAKEDWEHAAISEEWS